MGVGHMQHRQANMWIVLESNEITEIAVADLVATYADLVNYFQILQYLYPECEVVQPIPNSSALRHAIPILRGKHVAFSVMRVEATSRPS